MLRPVIAAAEMLRPVIAAAENGRRYCFKKKKIRWSLTDKWDP